MPGVSEEQVKHAREVDLLRYLQTCEPDELIRCGNEYRTALHGSLVISNGKWIWNKTGIGGVSALDYLIKVRGMSFVDAVLTVCRAEVCPAHSIMPQENRRPPPKKLSLPKPLKYANEVVAYLRKRGISDSVLCRSLKARMLYESNFRGNPVCVFVGCDEQGQTRFACMRGTNSAIKQDCNGSDKRYGFRLEPHCHESNSLAVFESAIDAMSHASICEIEKSDWDGYRLSLAGTSPNALLTFLASHSKIESVSLCLDADEAGQLGARKIQALLQADSRHSHIKVEICPSECGKDYNDMLANMLQKIRASLVTEKHMHHVAER